MEFNSSLKMELSSLPTEKWWGDDYLCQVGEFWLMPQFIEPIYRVINHFQPLPSDIILASLPKTGTTWLKSLIYSIVYRSSKQRLTTENPHDLVPFLEVQLYASSKEPLQVLSSNLDYHTPRIFATHIPYQLLSTTLDSSKSRVVYVTRNPKDTLISTWHFMNKWDKAKEEPWLLDEAIDKFCNGHIPCGPYYDHVTGYRELSLKKPKNVYFVTFEDLIHDTNYHVKKLADFLGCPLGKDEVDEVVKSCSFGVLSSHEVNKSEESPTWFNLPYNSFFRKGTVGDHKNYLTAETIARIDALTKEKFHSSGFTYGI